VKSSANARAGLLIVVVAALFTYGLIHLFSVQFATGAAYPDYSSMRSSPGGAKLLYDSLSHTAGVTVSRNYFPLEYVEAAGATIFLLGVYAGGFDKAEPNIDPAEHLARRGNRVVIALRWGASEKPDAAELGKRWHVKFGIDPDEKHSHHLYFTEAPDWRVLDRDGDKILAIERTFEQGSLMLVSESRDFSNDSTVKLDRLGLVSAAIGDNRHIIFDEQHFGIGESGTVVGLARRFGLTGMAAGLAFCAALFLWKNAASFPPPVDAPRSEVLIGRTSIAGLNTLLSRHIRPADLASTCWNEWLTGKRREAPPGHIVRAEAILRDRTRTPLDAVREIQTVLQSKGPL